MFQENDLERLSKCPIGYWGIPQEDTCSRSLVTWALRKSFEGKLLKSKDSLSEIRGKFIDLWKDAKIAKDPGTLARTVGYRVFTLLLDYEVVHPEQPYNLVLASHTIQGKYALLRKRKGEKLPFTLVLHTKAPTLQKGMALPPDPIALARYIHVHAQDGYSNAQMLHYPIYKGKLWLNKWINLELAKRYLLSILKAASLDPSHPVAGDHCKTCLTKPCMEVFKNG